MAPGASFRHGLCVIATDRRTAVPCVGLVRDTEAPSPHLPELSASYFLGGHVRKGQQNQTKITSRAQTSQDL